MGVSRELATRDSSSQQADGHRNYVSEANYIEFDGVKVPKNNGILSMHFLILARILKACLNFQVVTPTGNVLVEDLTLRVESGSNLLITGRLCGFILPLS